MLLPAPLGPSQVLVGLSRRWPTWRLCYVVLHLLVAMETTSHVEECNNRILFWLSMQKKENEVTERTNASEMKHEMHYCELSYVGWPEGKYYNDAIWTFITLRSHLKFEFETMSRRTWRRNKGHVCGKDRVRQHPAGPWRLQMIRDYCQRA